MRLKMDASVLAALSKVCLARRLQWTMVPHAGNLDFVMQAKPGGIESARVQVRARKLLMLCLNAFTASRSAPELLQQPQRDSSWLKLLDLVIKLTGTASLSMAYPSSWKCTLSMPGR